MADRAKPSLGFLVSDVVEAWRQWVDAPGGVPARRRLIIQAICLNQLTYSWVAYDKALEHMRTFGLPPSEAPDSIKRALELCSRHGWKANAIRQG